MRLAAALLLFSLRVPSISADTYPRQAGVDVLHYTFRLTLTDENDEISGEATIDARFTRDGVRELALDLASAAGGKGMTVSAVTSGGEAAPYTHQANRLHIRLVPAAKAGEQRQFTVRYRGVPAGGLRIGANKFGERTFFSQNWPDQARQWLPVIDHPYDKASSEFLVTAPARYGVVSNGRLEEEVDLGDGRRRTHWSESAPIASWLNALGVAQFDRRRFGTVLGIPLETWAFQRDREPAMATLEGPARQAIEFFSERIGPYPYEKLAGVEAAGTRGGMELASAIFYGERNITGRPDLRLVAHEVAHQWFGDAVTERDWDDVWLSEGFATYWELMAAEHYLGRDVFVASLKKSRETVRDFEKKNPGVAVVHENLSDMRKVLNPLVYQKGAWTLHMLRGLVGEDRFQAGMRDYYRRYRDGNASTEDFRKVMEEHAGADLAWFFREWLRRAGSPEVEGTWRYNAAARRVEIELAQTQAGDAYRLPLEAGVTVDGVMRVEKIEMTARRERFEIAAAREPAAVVLDPECRVLMGARFK